MPDILQLIRSLTSIQSISGHEDNLLPVITDIAKEYCDEIYTDPLKSIHVIKKCGKKDAKTILIDAHIDEIGFMVTGIAGGFLRVAPIGGHDTRTLIGSKVVIYGRKTIPGIICSTPPHLQENDDDSLPKPAELIVDALYPEDKLKELVCIGDVIGLDGEIILLQNRRIASRGLDNKACAATLLYLLQSLQGTSLNSNLHFLFSSCEEVSLNGARTGAFSADPDIAFILDVNFGDFPGVDATRSIKLGEGVGLSYSASTSISLTKAVKETAMRRSLPFQEVAEAMNTGTNASAVSITRGGVPCAVLSVPLRGMHTASEIMQISDAENTAEVLKAYLIAQ